MKIIATGITGLVGSRIVELLTPKGFEFVNLSLETGVDITNPQTIEKFFKDKNATWVIHLAAKADVDGCEEDREKDMKIWGEEAIKQFSNLTIKEISKRAKKYYGLNTAFAINVVGTLNISSLCLKYRKKLIYVSTDFVFDGKKDINSAYKEDDLPNPINFYAQTKYLGEKIVQNLLKEWIICCIAYPYRAKFLAKKDFVRGIFERLKSGQTIKAVTDQIITPTFIDDIVSALEALMNKDIIGVYHLVGSSSHTPLEAANLISKILGYYNKNLIEKTTREEFYHGRAPRPFNLRLSNDKIKNLGVKMKTFKEGLEEVKRQLKSSNQQIRVKSH